MSRCLPTLYATCRHQLRRARLSYSEFLLGTVDARFNAARSVCTLGAVGGFSIPTWS